MLQIYNTLTKKKEQFKPIHEHEVSFYQCGATVYWTQHIGNLRAMVLADLIRRSLSYLGYHVKMARNYTDVGHMTSDDDQGEDKMEKAAKRENRTPKEIADHYIRVFESDCHDLNILEPDFKPRATDYIKVMAEMVQELIDKGYAYATDLAIYFDVSKATDYTKLSGQDLSKNISDAGKGEVGDPQKKSSIDFALWFFKAGTHENAIQTWNHHFKNIDQKVEAGFPGWHIECSAMSRKLLGKTIDLHMGGIEHVPVHHTNEIAQSEAANGVKFVNYWLHNEWLTVNGGKMSKSQGTAFSLTEIKEKGYDPLVLRYFFLQSHYRSKQNFTWEALDGARSALNNLRDSIRTMVVGLGKQKASEVEGMVISDYDEKFEEAIGNDFNFPEAIALMFDMLKMNDESFTEEDVVATILDFDSVLGLNLKDIAIIEIPEEVKVLAEKRLEARQNKKWDQSDCLREAISDSGFEIEDTPGGYILKKK